MYLECRTSAINGAEQVGCQDLLYHVRLRVLQLLLVRLGHPCISTTPDYNQTSWDISGIARLSIASASHNDPRFISPLTFMVVHRMCIKHQMIHCAP